MRQICSREPIQGRVYAGAMRGCVLGFVLIAMLGVSAHPFGQWLKHPTEGVPRKADGNAEPGGAHAAPARRQAGLFRHLARHESATAACPGRGAFIECGSRDRRVAARRQPRAEPAGRPALPAARRRAREEAARRRQPRRSARALPARQPAAVVDAAPPHAGHPHAEAAGAALRGERDVPADPHRRSGAAPGSDAGWNGYSTARWEGDTLVVQTEGFRDDLWIDSGGSPMSDVAKMTERHPPAELRHAGDRTHHRRSQELHPAVHRQPDAAHRARHRAGGRVLPGEREVRTSG